jgi:hypothetical protein
VSEKLEKRNGQRELRRKKESGKRKKWKGKGKEIISKTLKEGEMEREGE